MHMGDIMETTISPKPYVFHSERIERYKKDIAVIELQGAVNCDPNARKEQAFENLCWAEFVDATEHLTGRRVCITQVGHVLCTEYHVHRIIILNEIKSDDRSCFGIIYIDSSGNETTLRVTPTTKISVYPE